MGRLYAHLAASRVSTLEENYELGVDLEDEEGNWFIHRCVRNDLALCESTLQSSPNPRRLVKGKTQAVTRHCPRGVWAVTRRLEVLQGPGAKFKGMQETAINAIIISYSPIIMIA